MPAGFFPFGFTRPIPLANTEPDSEGGQGPKGDKGDKGDSVTAGEGSPSTIIPGVSVYIDGVSGTIYRYDPD